MREYMSNTYMAPGTGFFLNGCCSSSTVDLGT